VKYASIWPVKEMLNSLLYAETNALCRATRYERSPDREDERIDNAVLAIAIDHPALGQVQISK